MSDFQPKGRLKMMTTDQDQHQAKPAKAQDMLHRAADLMDERGKQYDQRSGERSMQATVTAFNAIAGYHLSEADGFLLLAILKMVRDQSREAPHEDSLHDLVAYASLYGEARLRGEKASKTQQEDAKQPDHVQTFTMSQKAYQEAIKARYAGR